MPTVARYGPRKVDPAALPAARLTAAETPESEGLAVAQAGERQGEALGQVGSAAFRLGASERGKIIQEEKDRADDVAVLNAVTQTGQWKNQRVYDPDSGALTLKGKDAFGLPEQINDEYTQVTDRIASTLTTDKQRFAYKKYTAEDGLSLDHQIRQHVYGEMQRYEGQELEAFLDNSRNQAILQASVPGASGPDSTLPRQVGGQLAAQEQAIKTHGPRLGMGPEQIQAAIDKTRSATHVGIIQNLLAQPDGTASAQAYYDETKAQIAGDQQGRIEKALEEGHVRKDAQAAADKITAEGGTLTEQRNKAKALSGEVRDRALEYIEHENALKEHAELEAERAATRGAYDILDRTKGDLTQIPPSTWASFDGGVRSSLRSYSEHLAAGTPIVTDEPTYYNLLKTAATDPSAFSAVNLLKYRHLLGTAEFHHVVGVQTAILEGNRAKLAKDLGPAKLQEDVIDEALIGWGIDPKAKYDTDEGKKKAALQGMLRARVEVQEGLTGKPVLSSDLKEMTDGLLSQGVEVPGSFWNLYGHAPWATTRKPLLDMTVTDITAGQRARIESALKTLRRPISDATVLDFFREYVARTGRPVPEK